jgi:hypothetical protein
MLAVIIILTLTALGCIIAGTILQANVPNSSSEAERSRYNTAATAMFSVGLGFVFESILCRVYANACDILRLKNHVKALHILHVESSTHRDLPQTDQD